MTDHTHIIFPSDTPQWPQVKRVLQSVRHHGANLASFLTAFEETYHLIHTSQELSSADVSGGLRYFFLEACSFAERQRFCDVVLGGIIDRALEIESLVPPSGFTAFTSQLESCCEVRRVLAASMVACSFLCLFPWQQANKQNLNMDVFFTQLNGQSQCQRLRMVLHYFERLTSDPGGPVASLLLIHQVTVREEMPGLSDWRSSNLTLCKIEVKDTGCVRNAGPRTLQVDGCGGLLEGPCLATHSGAVCFSPELLLLQSISCHLRDNEAMLIQGHETYTSCQSSCQHKATAVPHTDQAKRNSFGTLESSLCVVEPLSDDGCPYETEVLIGYISRRFTALQQRALQPLSAEASGEESVRDGSSVDSTFLSSPRQPDNQRHQAENAKSTAEHHKTADPQKPPTDVASPSTESPRSSTKTPIKQTSVTLPAVTVPRQFSTDHDSSDTVDRRRSSNLSDITSRRSSSTSSSRRSSSKRSSSEFSSEFEEYYDNFQRQERRLKPIVIEEESSLATLPEHSVMCCVDQTADGDAGSDVKPSQSRPPLHMTRRLNQTVEEVTEGESLPRGNSLDGASTGGARSRATQHTARSGSLTYHRHQSPVVHFVDNLVNQASEESRQQIEAGVDEESKLGYAGAVSCEGGPQVGLLPSVALSLDLVGGFAIEAAPQAPIDDDDHYFLDSNSPRVPSRRIELVEESPTEAKPAVSLKLASAPDFVHMSSFSSQGSTPRSARQVPSVGHTLGANLGTGFQDQPVVASFTMEEKLEHSVTEERRCNIRGHSHCRLSPTPANFTELIEKFATDFTHQAFLDALGELRLDFMETYSVETDSESEAKYHRKLLYYVDCLMGQVMKRGMRRAADEVNLRKMTPSTMCSSEEDHVTASQMTSYVEDFVQEVLRDSLEFYHRSNNIDSNRGSFGDLSDLKIDNSQYFLAEFGFRGRGGAGPRRGSCCESRRRSSGIRSSLLSDFEHELVRSNVSTPSLVGFDLGRRRASEPAAGLPLLFPSLETQRVKSSPDMTSSRELILDWLEECAVSSTTSNQKIPARRRTTSCHLDWFAQDLLVESFNDAFHEMFGDNFMTDWEMYHPTEEWLPTTINHSQIVKYSEILTSDIMSEAYSQLTVLAEAPSGVEDVQLEMIAGSFTWQVIQEAELLVRREAVMDKQCVKGERAVAMEYCPVTGGDAQLCVLLDWAAASRAGAPSLIYYTHQHPHLTMFETLARSLRHQLFTVGELVSLVFTYNERCQTTRPTQTLFEFLRESSI